MKRIYTLLTMLLLVCAGAWAETSTWESKEGWTKSNGGVASVYWFGVHTPGDATTTYHFTSVQLMQQTTGYDCYLAIARTNAMTTLSANHVVAISDNHLAPSQSEGALETYNFSDGVDLLGGTTYYFVFLSSNTPTNGAYPVQAGRITLNHQGTASGYGTYAYGNSAGSADWWPYYKATVESSATTGFCTGDKLGGTTGSGSGYKTVWTSSTSPSFTLTSSAANINGGSASGGLDIRSGSAGTATYTFTAPTGYVITGYKLFGNALNGNQTVTPAEGGSAVVFTGAGSSISVSGIKKASASFTLAGANNGLFLRAMQVTLAPYSDLTVTTLPTTNDQVYVIANARGTFNFADGATAMSVVRPENTNLDAAAQQIALVYHNDNYYLYSVNTGKYLTADNTLTAIPTDNEQVSITSTGNASYPWFLKFKNIANKNINNGGQQNVAINNWGTIDAGNSNVIMPAGAYDLSAALDKFNARSVTYNLSYGGNSTFKTVSDVTTTLSSPASDFVPSSFLNDCVSLSYSPETISSETTEVTVTATWNGPFEISPALSDGDFASGTKWYVVDIHSNAGDYTWQYDASSQEIQTPVIAKDAYDGLTNANLWCFIGNPFDGLKIYNKAAGSTYTLRKENNGNTVSYMSTTDDRNNFKVYASTSSISSSCCFKLDGDNHYLNHQESRLQGWTARDEGSSCRFLPAGKYYLNFIDGLCLDAPLGAVGTKEYFVNHPEDVSNINSLRSTIESNLYSDMTSLRSFNLLLDPVKDSPTIALGNGYYQILSAYPDFVKVSGTMRRMIFNGTAIGWSNDLDANNINAIFKLTNMGADNAFSIYSGNGQNYLSNGGGVLGSATAVTITEAAAKTAQYSFYLEEGYNSGHHYLHALGHDSGSGPSGSLTAWNAGANTASAWYILPVGKYDITMNAVGGDYYASGYWPMDVTISGATAYTLSVVGDWAVPTPLADNQVPAGTAVLLKGTSATATATINTDAAFSTDNENALQGTYVPKDFALNGGATEEYFLGVYNGKIGFYRSEVVSKQGFYTLGANKAYLSSGAEARGFAINWDDEVTGIGDAIQLNQKSESSKQVFDLQGRRVENPQRGMYIVNGRVVVVK